MPRVTSSVSRPKFPRLLMLIVGLAAVVLFFRLSHVDMTGDDAHYSVRAIGPVDFMFGSAEFQSTPILWFDEVPWWAHLSFHDHPRILFVVQHLFLSLHQSAFFAKLPYTLFALASLVLIFFVTQRFNSRSGVLAAALLALNAHFIWTGRVSYMESGVMFCILLALYFFQRFEDDAKNWWKFGLALGLALGVKFTTLFIIPALLGYVALRKRALFRERKFYFAFLVALVIQTPLFIYNFAMYAARGHFSLQFARLFHQASPWHLSGVESFSPLGILAMLESIGQSISWPYLVVFIIALVYTVWRKRQYLLLLSCLLFLTIQQFFIGRSGYAVSIYAVLIAPLVALAYTEGIEEIDRLVGRRAVPGCKALGITFVAYLSIFVLNSHVIVPHRGPLGWLKSAASSDNYGVAQLDAYLDTLVEAHPEITRVDPYGELKMKDSRTRPFLLQTTEEALTESLKHANVILFDDRISWFSRVWLFERRRFYQNLPVISISEQGLLGQIQIDTYYFVKAEEGAPLDSVTRSSPFANTIETRLLQLGLEPERIYRDDGVLAFKIYTVKQGEAEKKE